MSTNACISMFSVKRNYLLLPVFHELFKQTCTIIGYMKWSTSLNLASFCLLGIHLTKQNRQAETTPCKERLGGGNTIQAPDQTLDGQN